MPRGSEGAIQGTVGGARDDQFMESSSVFIEVTGWSDWVRREWAERAPKTLAELHDPDAFFAVIDGELSSKYAERTRTLGRIVDADILLTQIASGIPVEQWTSRSLDERRREAVALVTDFLLFDPRGHAARVEELSNLTASLPTPAAFARAIAVSTLDSALVVWALGDSSADAADESVQVKARRELAELYALHRVNTPLSGLTHRQLSTRLFVFRKVQRAYAHARSDVAQAEALVRQATGDLT